MSCENVPARLHLQKVGEGALSQGGNLEGHDVGMPAGPEQGDLLGEVWALLLLVEDLDRHGLR